MNIDLTQDEINIILQTLDQVSIKPTLPNAVQVTTIVQSILAKLKPKD